MNSLFKLFKKSIFDSFEERLDEMKKSLAELKEDIQKYADNNAKMENEKRIANKIFDTLLEKTNIDIQDTMINREIQALMGEFKQRINMQGGNFDQMLEKEGHEKVYAQLKEEAVKRITGKDAETILDSIGITCNKNMLPYDKEKPNTTSGIRIGSAAMTTRGLKEYEFKEIADIIVCALKGYQTEDVLLNRVKAIIKKCK